MAWGNLTWSVGNWGDQTNSTVTVGGIGSSINLDNVSTTSTVELGWGRDVWGARAWGNPDQIVNPSGVSLTTNLNSAIPQEDINTGWGRDDGWGTFAWGIAGTLELSGIEMTSNLGTADAAPDAEVTGQQLTASLNNVEGFASFVEEVTGFSLPMVLQYQEAVVDVTGIAMSMQEGDEEATPNTIAEVSATSAATWNGNFAWGYGVWGNQQVTTLAMSMQEGNLDPAPDAMVTGNAAAMFLGNETVTADANLSLSGISLTFTLGTAVGDANTIASPSGILLSMQEGDEETTANARVTPTGIGLTMTTGTVYNLIWNEVNTGTTSTWTEVDTAA